MILKALLKYLPQTATNDNVVDAYGHNGNRSPSNDPDSLNICLLSYRSDPFSGGQGVYVKYLSRELSSLGHSVDVISGKPYPELADNVNLIKLPGLNLFESKDIIGDFQLKYLKNPTNFFEWISVATGGFPEPLTFGRRAINYLRKTKKTYDVIHDNQSLSFALRRMKSLGYPVVSTIHHPITIDRKYDLAETDNLGEELLTRRWYNFLNMQSDVASDVDQILCVSENSRRRAIEDFHVNRPKTNVVHNGIDTTRFSPINDADSDPFRIITTASADVPIKGLKYLLKAIGELRNDFPEIKLTVVGELKEDGQTEKLIESLNINDRVNFHTHISHDRLVELYSRANIAVSPSLYEGFGFPAGEAMACETPIIATRGGALPEVVGSCGELVEPGNVSEICDAIRKYLSNENLRSRLASKGRKRVKRLFCWKKTAKQTVNVYRKAITNADN